MNQMNQDASFVSIMVAAIQAHADVVSIIDLNGFVKVTMYTTDKPLKPGQFKATSQPKALSSMTVRHDDFVLIRHDAAHNVDAAAALGWRVRARFNSVYAERVLAAGRADAEKRCA